MLPSKLYSSPVRVPAVSQKTPGSSRLWKIANKRLKDSVHRVESDLRPSAIGRNALPTSPCTPSPKSGPGMLSPSHDSPPRTILRKMKSRLTGRSRSKTGPEPNSEADVGGFDWEADSDPFRRSSERERPLPPIPQTPRPPTGSPPDDARPSPAMESARSSALKALEGRGPVRSRTVGFDISALSDIVDEIREPHMDKDVARRRRTPCPDSLAQSMTYDATPPTEDHPAVLPNSKAVPTKPKKSKPAHKRRNADPSLNQHVTHWDGKPPPLSPEFWQGPLASSQSAPERPDWDFSLPSFGSADTLQSSVIITPATSVASLNPREREGGVSPKASAPLSRRHGLIGLPRSRPILDLHANSLATPKRDDDDAARNGEDQNRVYLRSRFEREQQMRTPRRLVDGPGPSASPTTVRATLRSPLSPRGPLRRPAQVVHDGQDYSGFSHGTPPTSDVTSPDAPTRSAGADPKPKKSVAQIRMEQRDNWL